MHDKGVIIKEVCSTLDGMLKDTNDAGPNELDSVAWWTDRVITALCRWGLRKKWWVGFADREGRHAIAALSAGHCGGPRRPVAPVVLASTKLGQLLGESWLVR